MIGPLCEPAHPYPTERGGRCESYFTDERSRAKRGKSQGQSQHLTSSPYVLNPLFISGVFINHFLILFVLMRLITFSVENIMFIDFWIILDEKKLNILPLLLKVELEFCFCL